MLLEHLQRHARDRPRHVALRWPTEGAVLTYADLWEAITARARRLAGLDLGAAPVLIFGANNPESIVSFLGAMACGLTPSFMPLPAARFDTASFWASHADLFRHIGQGALIAPTEALADIRRYCPDISLTLIAAESIDQCRPADLPPLPAAKAAAVLQHSSGTTGLKKGVVLSYEAIERQIQSYAAAVDLGEEGVIASWLPLYHDMGLMACLMLPLTRGAQAIYIDPFYWTTAPQSLFDVIEVHRATHVWLPNFAFRHLERAVRKTERVWSLGSVKVWVNCSEPCKAEAFDTFAERYAGHGVSAEALACCYAMAETAFAVTQTRPGRPVARRRVAACDFGEIGRPVSSAGTGEPSIEVLSCGPAISGCAVRIEGAHTADLVYGQIQVAADFLFDGYYRAAERTAAVLVDGWYSTGDVGFIADGELYVCGRLDDRIIVGGRNLYAHEIEQLMSGVSGVAPGRAVAMGIYDPASGTERLVVAAEIGGDPEDVSSRLITALDASLGLRPADVRLFTDRRIIKTTSGKIDRKKNRERYLSGGFA